LPLVTHQCNISFMGANKSSVKIVPSILSADFTRLGAEVAAAEKGGADAIHVDVMDGKFVPNITVGPLVVEAVRRSTSLPLQVHLMIDSPASFIKDFARAGASLLLVHQESNWTIYRLLAEIKEAGMGAGIAFNPMTPISQMEEIIFFADMILVMTVEPGFGGQGFIPTMYDKIERLRRLAERQGRPDIEIAVDGGVNNETAGRLAKAGANVLIAGATVFAGGRPIQQAIADLRAAALGTITSPADTRS